MSTIEERTNADIKRIGEAIIDLIQDSSLVCDEIERLFDAVLKAFQVKEEQVKLLIRKSMTREEIEEIRKTIRQYLEE